MNAAAEALTIWTVRAAFTCYVAALSVRAGAFRPWWTAGFVFFLVHVAAAFHFHHGWSHTAAWSETQRQTAELLGGSGSGAGLWLNYLFTALWAADVWRLWRGADWGPHWRTAIQAFFAFLFFNATVVFGKGPIRWAGALAFAWLAFVWMRRRKA